MKDTQPRPDSGATWWQELISLALFPVAYIALHIWVVRGAAGELVRNIINKLRGK